MGIFLHYSRYTQWAELPALQNDRVKKYEAEQHLLERHGLVAAVQPFIVEAQVRPSL